MQIYNFRTNNYETPRKSLMGMTQDAPVQNLFECYILAGKSPFDAYGATLEAAAGFGE